MVTNSMPRPVRARAGSGVRLVTFTACLVCLLANGVEAKLEAGSAVDLSGDSFNAFLSNLPVDATVLMEYYAHW